MMTQPWLIFICAILAFGPELIGVATQVIVQSFNTKKITTAQMCVINELKEQSELWIE